MRKGESMTEQKVKCDHSDSCPLKADEFPYICPHGEDHFKGDCCAEECNVQADAKCVEAKE